MKPLLSVIVPILNEEECISSVLRGLIGQTLHSQLFEIIVVDGGSTDETKSIVKLYEKIYDNIRLLNNPRRLSSAARNIGANAAKGRYILYIDGHCEIRSHEMLNDVLSAFENGEQCISRPQPLIATSPDCIASVRTVIQNAL